MLTRRAFVNASTMSAVAVAAISGRGQAASIPEAATMKEAGTQKPLAPIPGPIITRLSR